LKELSIKINNAVSLTGNKTFIEYLFEKD
jgi:hypothetical protein